jgi:hypothetical protein
VFRPERLEHELRRLEPTRHVEVARDELVHATNRRPLAHPDGEPCGSSSGLAFGLDVSDPDLVSDDHVPRGGRSTSSAREQIRRATWDQATGCQMEI